MKHLGLYRPHGLFSKKKERKETRTISQNGALIIPNAFLAHQSLLLVLHMQINIFQLLNSGINANFLFLMTSET